ncbi:MAG: type II toxin-antitoxin system VapC family toxin [Candidatus Rokuibacteriota bacterium]
MRIYLDTSVLVKLYVEEPGSDAIRRAVQEASLVATSAIAYVEARAAFVRRRHEGELAAGGYRRIVEAFDEDWERYVVVSITDSLIRAGARMAETHRLRAYDAVHLASAASLHERLAEAWAFASWDEKLERAARREGLSPLPAAP